MAALAWVMMAIALWHFTVFVPDKFWGGIVGAFLAAIVGAVVFGFVVNGFSVPGRTETELIQALVAIPGTLIGLGICFFIGSRQLDAAEDEA
jgi:ABC-type tungstate transport system substrate-binding protein